MMTWRWAQIEVRMAQMDSPSTSLVGNSIEWTRSDVSLARYEPPKILSEGGKIYARVFIRVIRNLPLTLEGLFP